MTRTGGYPATEPPKPLPKVASGPAAGGQLAFTLQPGDTFRIGATDYLVTRLVSQGDGRIDLTVESLDGWNNRFILSKGGIRTRGAA